ncbi:DUF1648 domain-containing protein [Bacillus sp. JJ722]|uniref:DUF1648 domain-containing protein n=1 Tax=Bacillus sp. JJ722 TaxID=3122973 RepID=UPI002FFE5AE5
MKTFELIVITLSLLPTIIMLAATPYLSRRTEQFGVTIPETEYNHTVVKKLRKKYAKQSSITSIFFLIIMAIGLSFITSKEKTGALIAFSAIVIIFFPILFYYHSHKQMKHWQHKQQWFKDKRQERVMIQTNFRNEQVIQSNTWFLLPLAITVGTVIITILLYGDAPSQIPTHFNFKGQADAYSNKTVGRIAIFPFLQLLLTAMFYGINQSIRNAKQQINAANPNKSLQQNLLFRRRWSSFIIGTSVFIALLFLIVQLSMLQLITGPILSILIYVSTGIQLIWAVYLSITTGQGGSRMNVSSDEDTPFRSRNEDEYWRAGLFYMNQNDASIFVEKRFGSGWTVNFGNPITWIIVAGLILVVITTITILVIAGF